MLYSSLALVLVWLSVRDWIKSINQDLHEHHEHEHHEIVGEEGNAQAAKSVPTS